MFYCSKHGYESYSGCDRCAVDQFKESIKEEMHPEQYVINGYTYVRQEEAVGYSKKEFEDLIKKAAHRYTDGTRNSVSLFQMGADYAVMLLNKKELANE